MLEWALAQAQLERHVLESVVAVADKELKMDLKKLSTQVINHAHTANQPAEQRYTLTELCGYFGISRQAHYQLQRRQAQRTAEAETIVAAVQTIRHGIAAWGQQALERIA
ncbi:MAG: hypothetical protein R2932_07465 [Caldilineaceae bacterium]